MKTMLLGLCLTFAGCAHLGPAASCVSDPSLASEVVMDLRSDDYVKLLEALAAKVGLCVVDRTVESLLAPKAAADAVVMKHAQVWLATHPTMARLDWRTWERLNDASVRFGREPAWC